MSQQQTPSVGAPVSFEGRVVNVNDDGTYDVTVRDSSKLADVAVTVSRIFPPSPTGNGSGPVSGSRMTTRPASAGGSPRAARSKAGGTTAGKKNGNNSRRRMYRPRPTSPRSPRALPRSASKGLATPVRPVRGRLGSSPKRPRSAPPVRRSLAASAGYSAGRAGSRYSGGGDGDGGGGSGGGGGGRHGGASRAAGRHDAHVSSRLASRLASSLGAGSRLYTTGGGRGGEGGGASGSPEDGDDAGFGFRVETAHTHTFTATETRIHETVFANMSEGDVVVAVEHCHDCKKHKAYTRHDAAKYVCVCVCRGGWGWGRGTERGRSAGLQTASTPLVPSSA